MIHLFGAQVFKKSAVDLNSAFYPLACILLSVCSLHFTLSLHFTPGPQSTFYTDRFKEQDMTNVLKVNFETQLCQKAYGNTSTSRIIKRWWKAPTKGNNDIKQTFLQTQFP